MEKTLPLHFTVSISTYIYVSGHYCVPVWDWSSIYILVCVCVSPCLVTLVGVGSGVGRGARVNDTVS